MEIKLDDVIETINMLNFEAEFYFNISKGKFEFYVSSALEFSEISDEELMENSNNYIAFYSQYDLNEYKMMKDFAIGLDDDTKKNALLISLKGQGAYSRFKDMLFLFDLSDTILSFVI